MSDPVEEKKRLLQINKEQLKDLADFEEGLSEEERFYLRKAADVVSRIHKGLMHK